MKTTKNQLNLVRELHLQLRGANNKKEKRALEQALKSVLANAGEDAQALDHWYRNGDIHETVEQDLLFARQAVWMDEVKPVAKKLEPPT